MNQYRHHNVMTVLRLRGRLEALPSYYLDALAGSVNQYRAQHRRHLRTHALRRARRLVVSA